MLSLSRIIIIVLPFFTSHKLISAQTAPGAEPRVPNLPNCRFIPTFAGVTPNDQAAFRVLVTDASNSPLVDVSVTYTITQGRNYGLAFSSRTDSNGNAAYVFQGSGTPGDIQQLTATFQDQKGSMRSCGISTLYVHGVQNGSIPPQDLFVVPTDPNACASAPTDGWTKPPIWKTPNSDVLGLSPTWSAQSSNTSTASSTGTWAHPSSAESSSANWSEQPRYPPQWSSVEWTPYSNEWEFRNWASWQYVSENMWCHHLPDEWTLGEKGTWSVKRSQECWNWTPSGWSQSSPSASTSGGN